MVTVGVTVVSLFAAFHFYVDGLVLRVVWIHDASPSLFGFDSVMGSPCYQVDWGIESRFVYLVFSFLLGVIKYLGVEVRERGRTAVIDLRVGGT